MKKIDAHAHIGDFGGWAGVGGAPEQLIAPPPLLSGEADAKVAARLSRENP